MGQTIYTCKENDNRIEIYNSEDKFACEIHFGTSLKSEGMIVIALADLKNAMYLAGYKIEKVHNL
jgi:hypothetical protein